MLKGIYKAHGISGFFRGLNATMMRDVPFNFCFFGSYHAWTSAFAAGLGKEDRKDIGPVGVFLSGGLAGMTSWTLIFPADMVKSRLQASDGIRLSEVVAGIMRASGVRGFYQGWTSAVMRAFPANAALFLGYETAINMLRQM